MRYEEAELALYIQGWKSRVEFSFPCYTKKEYQIIFHGIGYDLDGTAQLTNFKKIVNLSSGEYFESYKKLLKFLYENNI